MASDEQAVTHGGAQAVAAARAHGAQTIFTLSGGHVFPVYDGAVKADPPMPILDVRHEQTAVFAAEATARLTRTPGFAVLTAGPGVTNGISAITTAHFNGSSGVLLGPITKRAWTEHRIGAVGQAVSEAFRLASARHRGPVFLDVSLEALFGSPPPASPGGPASAADSEADARRGVDPGSIAQIVSLIAKSQRPVLVLGSDVWLDGADEAARSAAEELQLPVVANGQGRGILPAGHELLVTRARSLAFGQADLVIVAGTPLDFRLGYGEYGGAGGAPS